MYYILSSQYWWLQWKRPLSISAGDRIELVMLLSPLLEFQSLRTGRGEKSQRINERYGWEKALKILPFTLLSQIGSLMTPCDTKMIRQLSPSLRRLINSRLWYLSAQAGHWRYKISQSFKFIAICSSVNQVLLQHRRWPISNTNRPHLHIFFNAA